MLWFVRRRPYKPKACRGICSSKLIAGINFAAPNAIGLFLRQSACIRLFYRRVGFKRIFALSRRYTTVGLLFCSASAYANDPIATEASPKQILLNQLLNWLPADTANTAMPQGINDQRFKVPLCPQPFDFSFSDNSQRTIKAQCSSTNWQRLVRLKPLSRKLHPPYHLPMRMNCKARYLQNN